MKFSLSCRFCIPVYLTVPIKIELLALYASDFFIRDYNIVTNWLKCCKALVIPRLSISNPITKSAILQSGWILVVTFAVNVTKGT